MTNDCVSCGAALSGRYCAACGEKVLDDADLDWRHHLLHELPHALFEMDGAFPRTVVSLFTRPGELAQAFVAGRRRRFLSPVRLYILAFVAYEIIGGLLGHGHRPYDIAARARLIDQTGLLQRLLDLRGVGFWRDPATQARLAERARWVGESGTFLVALFLGGFQSLVLVRLHRRYLEHLSLALNVTTFFLLCTAIGQILIAVLYRGAAPGVDGDMQTVLAVVALPLYWFFGARRFYGISTAWSLATAAVMTVGTAVIAALINILALAILIATA